MRSTCVWKRQGEVCHGTFVGEKYAEGREEE